MLWCLDVQSQYNTFVLSAQIKAEGLFFEIPVFCEPCAGTVSYVLSLLSVDSGYCLLDQLWAKVEELVDEHRGKRKMGKCYGQ